MKITDYEKVAGLVTNNVFLLDGDAGTKTILAHDLANALLGMLSSKEQVAKLTMSDLERVSSLTPTDMLMVGTSTGTKAISANEALFAMLDAVSPPELHRTVFRGKNLGTALLPAQKSCIQDGTFKGLWLGDYWVIGGRNWRIVDIDYWYNCGDAAFTKHHLVIMPDASLYAAQMNETNITTGGYVGSKMYTTNLANAKTLVNSAFGNAVLVHRDLLVNAVADGYSVGGSWYDSSVELPNEIMMYGSYVFTPAANGTIIPYRYTINKSQLALFQACPKFITNRDWYWLRDVVSAARFAYVANGGDPACSAASGSFGVRPVFAIG